MLTFSSLTDFSEALNGNFFLNRLPSIVLAHLHNNSLHVQNHHTADKQFPVAILQEKEKRPKSF